MSALDLDVAADEFVADLMLAIGALSIIDNPRLNAVAQSLYEARPLLAGLIALGHRHVDELETFVEAAKQHARDVDEALGIEA